MCESDNQKYKVQVDELLTVEQVASILKISPKTIRNMIVRKAKRKFPVPAFRSGGHVRFKAQDVQEYIDNLPQING